MLCVHCHLAENGANAIVCCRLVVAQPGVASTQTQGRSGVPGSHLPSTRLGASVSRGGQSAGFDPPAFGLAEKCQG